MATATNTKLYKYDDMKRIWYKGLRANREGNVVERYFDNFVHHHGDFDFYVVQIYDGTSHLMVNEDQYQAVKRGLLRKITGYLNDLNNHTTIDAANRIVLEKRINFSSQQQLERELRDLKERCELVRRRACSKSDEQKTKLRQMFSSDNNMKFLSFDLEVDDQDHKTMLEIGYVKFTLREGDQPEYFHAIVNEDIHNREGFDRRDKFRFGTTAHMTLREAAVHLQRAVAGSDALVTHSGYHDLEFLADNDISIAEKPMFDTQVLALKSLKEMPYLICWGLRKMLGELRISVDESILHNAGNDAHYTMLALKALAKKVMPSIRF